MSEQSLSQTEKDNAGTHDDNEPDSLAEATTAALPEDALGGHATQKDVNKKS